MQKNLNTAGYFFDHLWVRPRPGNPKQGILQAGERRMICALGRSGMGVDKREGDGKTPMGSYSLLCAYLKPGGLKPGAIPLPAHLIGSDMGWCDESDHRLYNQPVRLPFSASHEKMLRDDRLYNVVIVLDYNVRQRMRNRGSAIFFHIAHPDYRPTEGCVAISPSDMAWLVSRISTSTVMTIG